MLTDRLISFGKVTLLLATALMLLCLPAKLYGQSSGSTTSAVTGVVQDEQGATIGGATVSARNLSTNFIREVVTTDDGTFLITQLPPGDYELMVKADNFTPKTTHLELVLGTTTLFNFSMVTGGVASEVIEVTATNLVSEGRTESSTNVNRQNIDNLPINRRDFLDFSLTAARVTSDRAPGQGASATSKLSFNAQSARANNITIDGLDNNDIGSGSVRATFSQDAVQEFQVVSDNYSAEFGRALGGVINIVTRGGSNDLHGSLFFLNRNDTISARDAFAAVKPPYQQYQFGATLGGAIKKDKIFFFTSFERLSIKQNNIVTISDQTAAAATRLGFLLKNGPIPFAVDTTTILARADWRINPSNLLYVRYNFGGSYNGALEPFGGLIGNTNGGIQKLRDNTFAISETYINSRLNLVNEVRFLYGPRNQDVLPINNEPQVRLNAPEGFVTFGRGTFLPQIRRMGTYQFVDNVSLTRGRHQIKFGGDFSYLPLNDKLPLYPGGLALFLPLDFAKLAGIPGLPFFTGLEVLDPSLRSPAQRAFLMAATAVFPTRFPGFPKNVPLADLSLPTAYSQGFGPDRAQINTRLFSIFVQDDFKLRPNLLIKVGMRYDIGRVDSVPTNNGNFSPRIAINYRPNRLPKLNVHGAFGLFYATPITGPSVAILLNNSGNLLFPTEPFPFSVLPFAQPGHHFADSEKLPDSITYDPRLSGILQYQPNLRASYTEQANLGFDYFIGNDTEISISYDFVRGLKLFAPRNINPVVRPVLGDPVESSKIGRPDTTRGDVPEFESAFDSYYHGLTISISRRFSNHVGFLAHYTFSKAIDNTLDFRPDLQEMVDSLRIGLERGLSVQDVRSRFVLSGVWDLNYTKNRFLTGFQLSTIVNLESGHPYNLLAGLDLNNSGDAFFPADRPLVGGVSIGRNVGILPGLVNVDLRLTRNITIKERYHIEAFFEAFNLFNRVNISEIDRTFGPDAQGNFNLPKQEGGRFIAPPDHFRNAFSPRQFQFGFRVKF